MNVRFSPPDITEAEINEVVDTLRSGWITTGPKTKLFESHIAEFCTTNKAVCVSSATAALELALRVLGVHEGDEVITSAYTYTASASVACHVGATPVLVDIQKDKLEMDYDKLAEAITERTKVIIPVDIGGIICDYDRILKIVNDKKHLFKPNNEMQAAFGRVIILADAAHSFGASQKGIMSGNLADFSSFSFHAVKNFTTAEGGALTWKPVNGISDDSIYTDLMLLALHGQTKDALHKEQIGGWEYDIVMPAYKYNMTDIMASIGLVQMKRYAGLLKRRREIIERYDAAFAGKGISLLNHYGNDFSGTGHLYITRLDGRDVDFRNEVINKMGEDGVACNVHYKPLPMMTAYKNMGFDIKNYPNAYDFYKNEITLPLHTLLTDEEVGYVIERYLKHTKG